MQADTTRQKILDEAERLFAEQGVQATSLRTIVNKAGVNVAAIHYHFGSKEAVIREIIARRFRPLHEEKIRLLDELEEKSGGEAIPVETLIKMFIEPHLKIGACEHGELKRMFRLMGELEHELGTQQIPTEEIFNTAIERYLKAFRKALPGLSRAEIKWRFTFMLGAVHSIMLQNALPPDAPLHTERLNVETVVAYLITFLKPGFQAPPTDKNQRTT